MTKSVDEQVDFLLSQLKTRQHYEEAVRLIEWDLRTGAPKKGAPLRAEAMGTLSDKVFRMRTSESYGELLDELSRPEVQGSLSPMVQRLVVTERRAYERNRKVPAPRNHAYEVLRAKSESVWEEAKLTSDFNLFAPYLEQIVNMKREFVDYWGYADHPYNALVDEYEPGMTVAQLDSVFSELRTATVRLLQAIQGASSKPDRNVLEGEFPKSQQRELSVYFLNQMGYDFGAGRLDETVHPFEESLNRYDVRVTTNYRESDLAFALFATLHEGGHALYEQGVDPALIGTPLCRGTSLGIHESQSRFWENMIGLSHPFWEAYYGKVQSLFPALTHVPLDEFYRAANVVTPSLIRIEADELTYNLHIMLRYDLEKELIMGRIQVRDLPELWNTKMQEYLGIRPDSDARGVLQDVHWSGGDIGYFPTYALGNLYSAQFRHQLETEMPDYLEQVRQGHLLGVKRWFNEKVHCHGAMMDPVDLVVQVTGEAPNPHYLIDYFHQKFGALYQLSGF